LNTDVSNRLVGKRWLRRESLEKALVAAPKHWVVLSIELSTMLIKHKLRMRLAPMQ